ncbi:MAG: MgtC/SapB family protein [Acidimicrobiia bacterium]|nr:MgtC/SapB family protein [Acidimicrobiia bacterium]
MGIPLADAALRLLLAALLAGAVGLEREVMRKAAGFRTHMLVGLGAALFTLLSIEGFGRDGDPGRVAAQIVTGIGFLGAGAIFREGATVKGLTTAAGLWAVAAIGMAAGAGLTALATVSATIVLLVLLGLRTLDSWMDRRLDAGKATIEVRLSDSTHFGKLWKLATKIDPTVENVAFNKGQDDGGIITLDIDPKRADALIALFENEDGVRSAERIS